jgi:hypothetical protein
MAFQRPLGMGGGMPAWAGHDAAWQRCEAAGRDT